MKKIRIATRASQLALWQANYIAGLLRKLSGELALELVHLSTAGDQDQSQPLRELGGTGVFTREIQRAVIENQADIAVHSLKDLPTAIVAPELTLAAIPIRANRFDALVLPASSTASVDAENPLDCLPQGGKVGSGSPRRQAQLLAARNDLQVSEIRGNLNTRLRKLDAGEYDAIILAAAGLQRLGWESRLSAILQPPLMYPAVGQGALGIECRADDSQTISLLNQLTDFPTRLTTLAERTVMANLQAGCHAPLGISCTLDPEAISLTVIVLSLDGCESIQAEKTMPVPQGLDLESEQAEKIAIDLASAATDQLLDSQADVLIAGLR